MRDLNFFEPYIEKREFKFDKMIILYALLVFCILGTVVIGIYNQIQINSLDAQITKLLKVAEDPKTVKKINEIKELESEVNIFSEEVSRIIELDNNIQTKDVISEDLLYHIKSKMPNELFLTNLSAFNREIQISGIAKDTYSIAEFSKGLGLNEDVESIFVSNINSLENYYSFVLNISLEDVSIDGSQTAEE